MFEGRTAAQVYVTPDDETVDATGLGTVEERLVWCFDQARGPIVLSEYQFSLRCAFDALGRAITRGIPLLGILDHLQESGPTEKPMIMALAAQYPDVFRRQELVIGHSDHASQILHSKKFVFNAPLYGYQPPADDYDTPDEAFAAGACVSWFGSWNVAANASKQANDIIIMPGLIVGTMFTTQVQRLHDYIRTTQQSYQVFPQE